MYVKRSQHQQHYSISLGTLGVGGRISPTPAHAASNPVVLQAPVVQHIRASSCRTASGGIGVAGGGQWAALGNGASRNEPHPLARLVVTADREVDDCVGASMRSAEASRPAARSVASHVAATRKTAPVRRDKRPTSLATFLCLSHPTLSAKALCFRAVRPPRSFVRSFVRTDLVTTISYEQLEQSR